MENKEKAYQEENPEAIEENIFMPQEAENPEEKKSDEIAQNEIIQKLLEEVADLKDKLLRQMADSENMRTRFARLTEEAKDYAIFAFAKDMIPVMDNLSRALEHLPGNLDRDTENIIAGVKMTQAELESAFKKNALELINPVPGDKFDYNLHHAISQIVTNEYEDGIIVNTMQNGYKIKDRLIRPAGVAVAKKS